MSKQAPWIRFFPSDWLAGTRGLSASETGIYITLIASMYERGEPVPEDHKRLSRLCGASNSTFQTALATLIEAGKLTRVDGGLWNDRVQKERVYLSEKSQVGFQAANARWGKTQQNQRPPDADAMQTQCVGNAIPDTRYQIPDSKEGKEERKIPPLADLPKAKGTGKTLCPEDYEPKERHFDLGRSEGLDLHAILRARDEMVSWSRGNGEKRLDWDAVFANWLRRNAAKARAGPGAQRAGNGTGFNGKETLGDILNAARASIAAKEHGNGRSLELLALPDGRRPEGGRNHQAADGVSRPASGPDGAGDGLLRGVFGRPDRAH